MGFVVLHPQPYCCQGSREELELLSGQHSGEAGGQVGDRENEGNLSFLVFLRNMATSGAPSGGVAGWFYRVNGLVFPRANSEFISQGCFLGLTLLPALGPH